MSRWDELDDADKSLIVSALFIAADETGNKDYEILAEELEERWT